MIHISMSPPCKFSLPILHLVVNAIYYFYNTYFNANDVFNHHLCTRYFPNDSKSGWRGNYTDFLFAAYQMNLYTLWHEIMGYEGQLQNEYFTELLYRFFGRKLCFLSFAEIIRQLMVLIDRELEKISV
jgi:hypothetical protein